MHRRDARRPRRIPRQLQHQTTPAGTQHERQTHEWVFREGLPKPDHEKGGKNEVGRLNSNPDGSGNCQAITVSVQNLYRPRSRPKWRVPKHIGTGQDYAMPFNSPLPVPPSPELKYERLSCRMRTESQPPHCLVHGCSRYVELLGGSTHVVAMTLEGVADCTCFRFGTKVGQFCRRLAE